MTENMRRAQLYALAGIVGIVVIAFVVLTLGHADTGPLLTLASPIVAAFLVLAGVEKSRQASDDRHADTVAKLDKITHQTNGVLQEKIENAVANALAAREAAADPVPAVDVELDPEQPAGG